MSRSEQHLDDELLALRALGEPLPPDATAHLNGCLRCAAESDQLAAVVTTARQLTAEDGPQAPPPHVWEAISNELELDHPGANAEPELVAPSSTPGPPEAGEGTSDNVVSLAEHRRRWSTGILVAASMVGVIAGGVLALGGTALVDSETTAPVASPAPDVVGSTSLVALPQHEGSGAAEIVKTPQGPELVVEVETLSSGDGFYEVWLIDPETFEMVGLGALNDNSGRFPIPDGLDLSRYTVVDVSIEPYDGDPVHSKDSVVRGEIST